MLRQLFRLYIYKVAAGNDDVGVDVVSEFVNLALDQLLHQTSLGSAITPLIADSASVAGLQR